MALHTCISRDLARVHEHAEKRVVAVPTPHIRTEVPNFLDPKVPSDSLVSHASAISRSIRLQLFDVREKNMWRRSGTMTLLT